MQLILLFLSLLMFWGALGAPSEPKVMAKEELLKPQKRNLEHPSIKDISIMKNLILSRIVSELQDLREQEKIQERELEQEQERNELEGDTTANEDKKSRMKRMFLPLKGRPEDAQSIKRQIRYHQCYFNPISCFR